MKNGKTVTHAAAYALMQTLTNHKRSFCRKLYREGQPVWHELRPYETIEMLLRKITPGEYEDILSRPEEAKPVSEYIELTGEQMRALNNLKAALDACERLGIAGYSKIQ